MNTESISFMEDMIVNLKLQLSLEGWVALVWKKILNTHREKGFCKDTDVYTWACHHPSIEKCTCLEKCESVVKINTQEIAEYKGNFGPW